MNKDRPEPLDFFIWTVEVLFFTSSLYLFAFRSYFHFTLFVIFLLLFILVLHDMSIFLYAYNYMAKSWLVFAKLRLGEAK